MLIAQLLMVDYSQGFLKSTVLKITNANSLVKSIIQC